MNQEIYLVDGARTAIGNFGGGLASQSAVQLGTTVVQQLLQRHQVPVDRVDDVLMGCVLQAGQGQNVARQVALGAGIPAEKTALTVNMVCGSGLRTVAMAAQAIACQDADLVVAGGCESMSQAAFLVAGIRDGVKMGHQTMVDSMIHDGLWDVFGDVHMGITAENLARKYELSREAQDAFAAASQQKAERALQTGVFADEIVPVSIPQRKGDPLTLDVDEFPRAGITAEKLAQLRPAFQRDGTVTAGNASGINDGAAAVLVASAETCAEHGWSPLARVKSWSWQGTDPSIMGIGPVEAVKRALEKANWSIDQLDLIEANEAFAAQALSVNQELGWDPAKVNVHGGAIALGHPIGASGTRILVTLMHALKRQQLRRGLATLCIGGGMGIALCIESDPHLAG